ncbi:hypothetical protein BDV96DRAFT_648600 [Lophiotrema nucula]|uniref:Rhodopsin domain-containing protein n=1 Tax=Lophiotrema nucula TaxID=690887 RepID=A0A6A5Z0K8_9PLEO|nr:hypothetical protein BDV96DRAFT_648600 [Lophiotrema nucula]
MSTASGAVTIESWTLYALGVCLIASRLISRRITLGSISSLQCDDWLMLLVLLAFTGVILCANQVYEKTSAPARTTDDEIWRLKTKFALEELQLLTIWLVKACLLILYRRIFPGAANGKERRFLSWITLYCLLAFLAIQILLPLWCTPVEQYWSVSQKNEQCATYRSHLITTLALDLTTTLAVLIFPIPFIPTPRKLLIILLFVLGVFVLILGVLGRYYLLDQSTSTTYLLLYCAEAAAAIYFANLPFLSSLVTSTSTARLRQVSSRLSLSHWPRSIKSSPHLRIETLNSGATSRCSSPIDLEDSWSDCNSNITPATPMASVLARRPTDPPPELEDYLSIRRPSTRGIDFGTETPSYRPSTRGTEGDARSRQASVRTVETGDWSRRPSVRTAETSDWSRRPSLKSTIETPNWSRRPSSKGTESAFPSRLPSLKDADFEDWKFTQSETREIGNEERRGSVTSWYHAS